MKKWMISLIIITTIGFVGYKMGMNYMSDKMIDQVTEQVLSKEEVQKMLEDPEIQKTIQEQVGHQGLAKIQQHSKEASPQPSDSSLNPATDQNSESSTPSEKSRLVFSSKEEALSFLLTKFSMQELRDFASKAQGGLTAEEKEKIKTEMMARISAEEFQALKVLGLIEISKRAE